MPTLSFQINREMANALVTETIGGDRGNLAIDLYSGVGLFTVPLARRFAKVVGVESNATAVRFAKRNLQQANLAHATVVTAKVSDWLLNNRDRINNVDLLLLDPPEQVPSRRLSKAFSPFVRMRLHTSRAILRRLLETFVNL